MSGRMMKYPYTIPGKAMTFPWKYYFQKGRGFRLITFSVALWLPVVMKLQGLVNCDGNKQQWKTIRDKRHHNPFAVPHE